LKETKHEILAFFYRKKLVITSQADSGKPPLQPKPQLEQQVSKSSAEIRISASWKLLLMQILSVMASTAPNAQLCMLKISQQFN
jgi:hypothetical protein